MKLAFRSTPQLPTYMDKPETWKDGMVRDVPAKQAKTLCESFPDNFFPADKYANMEKAKAKAEADAAEAAKTAPPAGDKEALNTPGDTTGQDTSKLTDDELKLYEEAAKKTDAGMLLTPEEQTILQRVEGDQGDIGDGD